jgi:hypothetical protein
VRDREQKYTLSRKTYGTADEVKKALTAKIQKLSSGQKSAKSEKDMLNVVSRIEQFVMVLTQ